MKLFFTAFTALLVWLLAVSCAPLTEPVDPGTVRQAIEAAAAKFAAAFNRGDAEAVAAFYAKEAKVLPPNSAMVTGESAIRAFWQGFIEMTATRELTLEVLTVDSQGDLAYEVGAYTLSLQLKNALAPIQDQGKYVVVWKRSASGSWMIVADIWNSDLSVSQ
jgi:uncharacterized protein (TIGR02246 family)